MLWHGRRRNRNRRPALCGTARSITWWRPP